MIIHKIDSFWLDEDRAELEAVIKSTEKYEQDMIAVQRQIDIAQEKNLQARVQELLEQKKQMIEHRAEQQIDARADALQRRVEQRYVDSYQDNPQAIFDTIAEVLNAYTIEDFQARIDSQRKVYLEYKEKLKGDVSVILEEQVKEGYDNCLAHLYMILRVELNALVFYDIPLEEGTALLQAKARSLYPKRTRKKKIDLAEIESDARLFNTIRQGNTTNNLAKFGGRDMTIDEITHEATFKKGEYILKIPNYTSLSGLKTSTQQLLDIINIELTESGAKSPTVCISLTDYMTRRGLKDRKEARNQVKNDLEVLQQASIRAERRSKGNTVSYEFINIADSGKIDNGSITFTFGTSFYNMLLSYPVMPYPTPLLKINGRTNPNSNPFGRKIAEHKNMNIGKPNENIISVKTLLDISNLPTYEEVMQKGNRNVTQKIIAPFERDLDKLSDIFTWHYCHSNNEPLTEAELQNLSYDIFKDLLIYVTWNEYPDQSKRLEKKRERMEQAKKAEAKGKKKKG